MKKYCGYIIPAAVCLAAAAVLKFALVGYSFLAYFLTAVAAVILIYMALRILEPRFEKPIQVIRKLLTYCIILFAVALAVTESVLISEARNTAKTDPDVKYVVVLGAGVNGTVPSLSLSARLNTALEYWNRHTDAQIIVSGGQGAGEDISEAECMARWLTEHGVDESKIILEGDSHSTRENLVNTRRLIDGLESGDGPICIVTAGYHVMRAKPMALDNGFTHVYGKAANTGLPILELNYYLREAFALWYYMLTR